MATTSLRAEFLRAGADLKSVMEWAKVLRNLVILTALLGLVVPLGIFTNPTVLFFSTLVWGSAVLFVVGAWVERRRAVPRTQ